MDDKCVVCGEADEGKPLYKKLGSGEYNVEVIVALRDLELTSLPESAKLNHYICWDCDETILAEYGRYLENEEKRKAAQDEQKEKRRVKKAEQRKKRKVERQKMEEEGKRHNITVTPIYAINTSKFSKTKKLEIQRANNAHHSNHCLMCDSTFDSNTRGYQRFSLKKMVNDDMDVAKVMEHLGLARCIAPEMKGKRFVCSNCFYTIRRNYKDKLLKGSSIEKVPSHVHSKKDPIHRATPDEHAAEIAKLLPPALVECYKIMTSNSFEKTVKSVNTQKKSGDQVQADAAENPENQKSEAEVDDEGGLHVSQDEHGNYVIDMKVGGSPKQVAKCVAGADGKQVTGNKAQLLVTPRKKKKNVLLPKRHHHHLTENSNSLGQSASTQSTGSDNKTVDNGNAGEDTKPTDEPKNMGTCNICGRTYSGKPDDWWHNLNGSLSGFESITIAMALQLLETSLASTNEKARLACQVCLPCYGMVSTGFRIQVVQRIARQKNIDASKVNFSKVKVRMVSKEELCGIEGKTTEKKVKEKEPSKIQANDDNSNKLPNIKMNNNCSSDLSHTQVGDGNFRKSEELGKKGLKRKNGETGEKGMKKQRVHNAANDTGLELSSGKNQTRHPINNIRNANDSNNLINVNADMNGSNDSEDNNTDNNWASDSSDSEDSSCGDYLSDSASSESGSEEMDAPPQLPSGDPNKVQSKTHGRKTSVRPDISPQQFCNNKKTNSLKESSNCVKGMIGNKLGNEITGISQCKEVNKRKDIALKIPGKEFMGNTRVKEDNGNSVGKKVAGESCVKGNVGNYLGKETADSYSKGIAGNNSGSKIVGNDTEKKISSNSSRKGAPNCRKLTFYDVRANCALYFALSKMKKVKVVLNDIRRILPKEAFEGKTLTVRYVIGSGYHVDLADEDLPSSPLQFLLNTLAPSNRFSNPFKKKLPVDDAECAGRCVVCAVTCYKAKSSWHNIEEDIDPPSLLVPIRWVCASLSIPPMKITDREREEGRVCDTCMDKLSKEFNHFVKAKIAQSCEMKVQDVSVSDYIITFNQETMNIEADPVDLTPEEEVEESEKVFQKILPVIRSINMDGLVNDAYRLPLEKDEYSIWLLLVLNELRVQIGLSMQHLVSWLTLLMPTELHLKGLQPCEDKLIPFIMSVAMDWDAGNQASVKKLNNPLPVDLFTSVTSSETIKECIGVKVENEVDQEGVCGTSKDKGELKWEDFLRPVDLDKLYEGTAKPLPKKHFSNGLLYALWKVLQFIGGDDDLFASWIKQISPIELEADHMALLVAAPIPLHNHLENHPEDLYKLRRAIIPESATVRSQKVNSKSVQSVDTSTVRSVVSKKPQKENSGDDRKESLVSENRKKVVRQLERKSSEERQQGTENIDDEVKRTKRKRQPNVGLNTIKDVNIKSVSSPLSSEDNLTPRKKPRIRRDIALSPQKCGKSDDTSGSKQGDASGQDVSRLVASAKDVAGSDEGRTPLPISTPSSSRTSIVQPKEISGTSQGKVSICVIPKNQVINEQETKVSLQKKKNTISIEKIIRDGNQEEKFKVMNKKPGELVSKTNTSIGNTEDRINLKKKCADDSNNQAEKSKKLTKKRQREWSDKNNSKKICVEGQENKDQEESISLANKVKQLESQLQAIQQQNQELMKINQKLIEVSTDENEDVDEKVGKKEGLLSKIHVVNSISISKMGSLPPVEISKSKVENLPVQVSECKMESLPPVEINKSKVVSPPVQVKSSKVESPCVEINKNKVESLCVEINKSEMESPCVENNKSEMESPCVEINKSEMESPCVENNKSEMESPCVEINKSEMESPCVEINKSKVLSPPVQDKKSKVESTAVEVSKSKLEIPPVQVNNSKVVSPPVQVKNSEVESSPVEIDKSKVVSPPVQVKKSKVESPPVEISKNIVESLPVQVKKSEVESPSVEITKCKLESPPVQGSKSKVDISKSKEECSPVEITESKVENLPAEISKNKVQSQSMQVSKSELESQPAQVNRSKVESQSMQVKSPEPNSSSEETATEKDSGDKDSVQSSALQGDLSPSELVGERSETSQSSRHCEEEIKNKSHVSIKSEVEVQSKDGSIVQKHSVQSELVSPKLTTNSPEKKKILKRTNPVTSPSSFSVRNEQKVEIDNKVNQTPNVVLQSVENEKVSCTEEKPSTNNKIVDVKLNKGQQVKIKPKPKFEDLMTYDA